MRAGLHGEGLSLGAGGSPGPMGTELGTSQTAFFKKKKL